MDYQEIEPKDVLTQLKELQIVDVRHHDEYVGELGHIPGSQLIVLQHLPQQIENLSKAKPTVFVCRSGGRSGRAAAYACQQGFETVYNMVGGMIFWNECGYEVSRETK